MRMIMYKNSRKFGGKLFSYEGFTGSVHSVIQATREMKRVNKNYAYRIVKVRDGYNIYSRKMRVA